ncbi:peptidylprolyl isomerase [Ruegeria sp. SCP11]|uniref:peptidylprolyl isomerase n=1 Tax=Ruegeria sp. SCP11 TaxID=3141378 RepID=UPI0033378D5E
MSILKEPLFHFFLLGIAIFGWFSYLNDPPSVRDDGGQIVIDEQDIDRLINQFQSTWQRLPTPQELNGMQDALLRQEVLVREARALGLDQGDSVVRNRLAQKMEFLTLSLAQSTNPDDATLQAHLAENHERFMQPGRVAFQQIGLELSTDPTQIEAVLVALNGGADPAQFSGPSLLPPNQPLSNARQVDTKFGRGFFASLAELPKGKWGGPVPSSYGLHLVKIDISEPASLPSLDQIRDDVLFDWRRDLKNELSDAQFDALQAKYEVTAPTAEDIARRLGQ